MMQQTPNAVDDFFATNESTRLGGSVLDNDSGVYGDRFFATLITDVAHGELTFHADGHFVYTPAQNFSGEDHFTYQISDGELTSAATVLIQVLSENNAPAASPLSVSVEENGAVSGALNATDIDGDALHYTLVAGPEHGSVAVAQGGHFLYTPNVGFSGVDSFLFSASDGALSDEAVVSIEVKNSELSLSKTVVATDADGDGLLNEPGEVVSFKLTLRNTGDVTLRDVTLSDPLTGLFETIDAIAPGESLEFLTAAMISIEDLNSNGGGDGDLDNQAIADAPQLSQPVVANAEALLVGNAAPIFSSAAAVMVFENEGKVLDLEASDDRDAEDAGLTFMISGGVDAEAFEIDSATGALSFLIAPDFENPTDGPGGVEADNSYEVVVAVTDSFGLTTEQAVSVQVEDVATIVTIALDDASIMEQESDSSVFMVSRTDPSGAITVRLDLDFGAGLSLDDFDLSGEDVVISGDQVVVTFDDGVAERALVFTPIDDIGAEAAEMLTLSIAPDPAYEIGDDSSVTATIEANDFVVTNVNDAGAGSLRQAIANANATPGVDVITFSPSMAGDGVIHLASTLTITDAVIIDGSSSPVPIMLSGDVNGDDITSGAVTDLVQTSPTALSDNVRIFDIDEPDADTEIIGLTITGGHAVNTGVFVTGGGAFFTEATLTLKDTVLAGNSAAGPTVSGGAIFSVDADIIVKNSEILDNAATGEGGAIHNRFGDIIVIDSVLSGNSVTGESAEGGALRNFEGDIVILDSVLEANRAIGVLGASEHLDAAGGAIKNVSGAIYVFDSALRDNAVTVTDQNVNGAVDAEGGAIRTSDGEIVVVRSTLEDNHVSVVRTTAGVNIEVQGGAIRSNSGAIAIKDSEIIGNSASGPRAIGGGIATEQTNSRLTLSGVSIESNEATGEGSIGGGAFIAGEAFFDRVNFIDNAATIPETDDIALGVEALEPMFGSGGIDEALFRLDASYFGVTLIGGAGADDLVGGARNDRLEGRGGDDILRGGRGDDVLNGGGGGDTLRGGAGDDVMIGAAGADMLLGQAGDDQLMAGLGDDVARGGAGNDLIAGNAGVDLLYGGAGGDIVFGHNQSDEIYGGLDDDLLWGGGAADIISGGEGNDRLVGGDGADHLFGGDGEDRLIDGAGDDVLSGGDGNDVFVFINLSGFDRIIDYQVGGDQLHFGRIGVDLDAFSITQTADGTLISVLDLRVLLMGVGQNEIEATDFIV